MIRKSLYSYCCLTVYLGAISAIADACSTDDKICDAEEYDDVLTATESSFTGVDDPDSEPEKCSIYEFKRKETASSNTQEHANKMKGASKLPKQVYSSALRKKLRGSKSQRKKQKKKKMRLKSKQKRTRVK